MIRDSSKMYIFCFYREQGLPDIAELIMEEIERRMRRLEEARRNIRLDQKIPECKVSYKTNKSLI